MSFCNKIFIVLLISPLLSSAQMNPGGRQIALAHADVGLSNDVFAIYNNPAGLSELTFREAGIFYSPSPFGMNELSNAYAAYCEPFRFGSVAVGFMTYGFELYKEHKLALAFSKQIYPGFLFGITAMYQTVVIENYGDDKTFTLNIGGITFLNENLSLGFYAENLLRGSFGKEKNQIPTILNTGLSYKFDDESSLHAALQKELDMPLSVRFGIEYNVIEYLSLRFGFMNEPSSFSGGIGIKYSFIQIDYSVFTHLDLGLTHQAGIIFRINKNN